MASFFRNSVIKEVGNVPIRIAQTTPASRITVIGLSLANLTENLVTVNVMLKDDTSVMGYYIKDIMLPPQSSLKVVNGGEKLILAPNNELFVSCNQSNAVDAIVSYVEIL